MFTDHYIGFACSKEKSTLSSARDDFKYVAFDPGLQEDDCCILLGIGTRAQLSRSCRKQQDCGCY